MKSLLKLVFALVASLSAGWSVGCDPARTASPRPLYNNITPTKQDPCAFAQVFFVGNCIPFGDIDLENVPAAASVDDANNRFAARAAAAILSGANTSIADGGLAQEQSYGLKILAKMGYADYFAGPDQVPGRHTSPPEQTLRQEVNDSVFAQTPGIVGSTINRDQKIPATGQTIPIRKQGEYDVLLTAYVKLYYKYYDALDPKVRACIFDTLLSQRGKYTDSERFALDFGVVGIPETENHRLMIQAAKYLTNQLYYQKSVADGHPDHDNFDNKRNGANGNPSMADVILGGLQSFLMQDFVEYNARNYQDYSMTALMNLASYAYDDRVKLAAGMVLDYISAKVAVSSNDLRRSPPFRRLNEIQHRGPPIRDGFLGSPLFRNVCCEPASGKPYEPDPQGAFYTMLAGNTAMLNGHAPENYAFEMVHAGLSDYRVPPSILDLLVNPVHRRFYQGFHHHAGGVEYVNELYAGSPSYLISAGGNPSSYAYTVNVVGIAHIGDTPDLGVAVPTTFMPTGTGTSLDQLIQFGQASTDLHTRQLCVAPDFACGGPIYVPDALEPKNDGDPTLVRDGAWTFVNRGNDGTKPGYYLAIFRVKQGSPSQPGASDWGFLEAYDTRFPPGPSLPSVPPMSFENFQAAVKRANPSMSLRLGNDEVNTYVTQSGQQIKFTVAPHSTIISTTGEPNHATVQTTTFAHGSILNSDQSGRVGPIGSGLIVISNPFLGTRITLDMRNPANPRRAAESGAVESAGTNEEVWVNFNYPGPGNAGDFGDPFTSLGVAQDKVAAGGTINIVPGARNEPVFLTKKMTIRSFPGSATIGRQ